MKQILTKKRTLIILGICLVAIEVIFLDLNRQLMEVSGYGMIDMSYYYGRLNDMLLAYHDKGMKLYTQMQLLDLVFICTYVSFLVGVFFKLDIQHYYLPLLPATFDLLEDFGVRLMINHPNAIGEGLLFLITIMKFTSFAIIILMMLFTIRERFRQ